jgi:tryptophanyl-tRNA synthetase
MKKRVLSGVRSTGNLHLGNYFGAIRNFIEMQENYDSYFFIANLHALTTHPDPELLKKSVRATLVEYVACGLIQKNAHYMYRVIFQKYQNYIRC